MKKEEAKNEQRDSEKAKNEQRDSEEKKTRAAECKKNYKQSSLRSAIRIPQQTPESKHFNVTYLVEAGKNILQIFVASYVGFG